MEELEICHLSDSFRSMMSPAPISSVSTFFSRNGIKWIALQRRCSGRMA